MMSFRMIGIFAFSLFLFACHPPQKDSNELDAHSFVTTNYNESMADVYRIKGFYSYPSNLAYITHAKHIRKNGPNMPSVSPNTEKGYWVLEQVAEPLNTIASFQPVDPITSERIVYFEGSARIWEQLKPPYHQDKRLASTKSLKIEALNLIEPVGSRKITWHTNSNINQTKKLPDIHSHSEYPIIKEDCLRMKPHSFKLCAYYEKGRLYPTKKEEVSPAYRHDLLFDQDFNNRGGYLMNDEQDHYLSCVIGNLAPDRSTNKKNKRLYLEAMVYIVSDKLSSPPENYDPKDFLFDEKTGDYIAIFLNEILKIVIPR